MFYEDVLKRLQDENVRFLVVGAVAMSAPGGFRYVVDDEQILRYLQVPIEQRLAWLEAANRFLLAAMPPETRAIWQKFRRGEV